MLCAALVREDDGDAHDPNEPREDQISHRETVPATVVKEPVATSPIVDKYHYHQGKPVARDTWE